MILTQKSIYSERSLSAVPSIHMSSIRRYFVPIYFFVQTAFVLCMLNIHVIPKQLDTSKWFFAFFTAVRKYFAVFLCQMSSQINCPFVFEANERFPCAVQVLNFLKIFLYTNSKCICVLCREQLPYVLCECTSDGIASILSICDIFGHTVHPPPLWTWIDACSGNFYSCCLLLPTIAGKQAGFKQANFTHLFKET